MAQTGRIAISLDFVQIVPLSQRLLVSDENFLLLTIIILYTWDAFVSIIGWYFQFIFCPYHSLFWGEGIELLRLQARDKKQRVSLPYDVSWDDECPI